MPELGEHSGANKKLLEHATYGLSALKTLIDNIVDKDAAPVKHCYPLAADFVAVAGSATEWAWGSWVEIVPEDTITEDFWVIGIHMALGASVDLVCQIGKGASGSESAIMDCPMRYTTMEKDHPTVIPIKVAANTRIAARTAQDGTGNQSAYVRVIYLTGL